MTGKYGGAAFILIYLVFLVLLGLPILVSEFAVGRSSRLSTARAFHKLEPEGSNFHKYSYMGMIGNYMLMMFYTMVAGWMMYYCYVMATGKLSGASADEVSGFFSNLMTSTGTMTGWMIAAVLLAFGVCSLGLKNGIERITKVMMICLLGIMAVLVVRAVTLPGGLEGLKFYLIPDFGKLFAGATTAEQWATFGDAVYAAMGQAFFTLSLGISAMEIFGSYIGKERSLTGEALRICGLDTAVALVAGLIIFPACFAFAVEPGSGPGLVFVTLPSVFNQMPLGQLWGTLFFLFMSFAALSTVVAVFENIMSFSMDEWGWSRNRACLVNGIALALLSLPCVLGFNVWAGVELPGVGNIQAIEDFLVSNNVLPLGALVFLLFCTTKRGWGFDAFLQEADAGAGLRFPRWARGYVRFVLPVLIVIVFVAGYVPILQVWLGLG